MGRNRKLQRASPQRIVVLADLPPETTISRVAIRSIYPSRLKYAGHVSGEAYEWADAGAVVFVRSEDADYLLSKRIGTRSCCGGSGQDGNKVFEYEEST